MDQPQSRSRVYRFLDRCLGTFKGEVALAMVLLGYLIGTSIGYQTTAEDLGNNRSINSFFTEKTTSAIELASWTPTPVETRTPEIVSNLSEEQ